MKNLVKVVSAATLAISAISFSATTYAADSCVVEDVWSKNPWSSKFTGAMKNSKSLQYPSSSVTCISGSNLTAAKKRVKGHFQPSGERAIFKLDSTKYDGGNARVELRSNDGFDKVSGKAKLYSSATGSKVYTIGQLFSSKSKQPVVRIEVRDDKVWPVIQYKAGEKAKRDTKFKAPSRSSTSGNYFQINMASDKKSVYVKIGGTKKTYNLEGYEGGSTYVKAGAYANGGTGSVSTNFEYIYFGN